MIQSPTLRRSIRSASERQKAANLSCLQATLVVVMGMVFAFVGTNPELSTVQALAAFSCFPFSLVAALILISGE